MVFIVHVKNVVRVEMERDRKPKPLENAIFYRKHFFDGGFGKELIKNNRFVTEDKNTVFQVPAYSVGQYQLLQIPAVANHFPDTSPVANTGNILVNDGTGIQIFSNVMGCGSNYFDSSLVGLVIGLGPFEAGQEGMVDVDRPTFEFSAELV